MEHFMHPYLQPFHQKRAGFAGLTGSSWSGDCQQKEQSFLVYGADNTIFPDLSGCSWFLVASLLCRVLGPEPLSLSGLNTPRLGLSLSLPPTLNTPFTFLFSA